MHHATGIEIGRFRLKAEVTEAQLYAVYQNMVDEHLARQPGWRSQQLVKLDQQQFIDLAYADSKAHAEAICASWQGNAHCAAFLALIEPVSMEFGVVVSG